MANQRKAGKTQVTVWLTEEERKTLKALKETHTMHNLKHFDFIPGAHWQTRKAKREAIYAVLATALLSVGLCLGVILGRFI